MKISNKVKQKLCGILFVILGIVSIIPDMDGTAAVLIIPAGIALICAKNQYLMF